MRCQTCLRNGVRHRVYEAGSERTLMAVRTYWDEDDNYVVDDPNTTKIRYRCSHGHEWTETRQPGIRAGVPL